MCQFLVTLKTSEVFLISIFNLKFNDFLKTISQIYERKIETKETKEELKFTFLRGFNRIKTLLRFDLKENTKIRREVI